MKHLKSYVLFESIDTDISDNIQYIEDLLLELKDSGFQIYIDQFKIGSTGRYGDDANNKDGLKIIITSEPSNSFKLLPSDIGEYLMSINSYLKDNGWLGLHPYNRNKEEATVNATLKDIKQVFSREVSDFSEYLKNNWPYNSPFTSVSIEYYKP